MVLWPSLLINSTGLHALPLATQLTLPSPNAPTSATGANSDPMNDPLNKDPLKYPLDISDPLALARAYVAGLPVAHYCKGNYFKLQGKPHTNIPNTPPFTYGPCLPYMKTHAFPFPCLTPPPPPLVCVRRVVALPSPGLPCARGGRARHPRHPGPVRQCPIRPRRAVDRRPYRPYCRSTEGRTIPTSGERAHSVKETKNIAVCLGHDKSRKRLPACVDDGHLSLISPWLSYMSVLQISRYWPGVLSPNVELVPDYAGMRPKLQVCPFPPLSLLPPLSPPLSTPCLLVCRAVPFGQDGRGLPRGRALSARPAPGELIRHRITGPDIMPRPSRPRIAAHRGNATPRARTTGREWQGIGRGRSKKTLV